MKHPIKFGILTGVLAGALIFALNSFAFHGGPTQRIEGLHAEGDTIVDGTQRPIMMGGDDGTSLKNINVDPTTGDVQVDVTNTVTVDLGSNNDVVATAGLLHANSPMTLVDTFVLFDGSAETQIATTNLGASKAITITGTGTLEKICIIVSLGTPFAEAMSIIFFDADPGITIEDASITLAQAQNIQAVVSLTAAGFRDNFATAKINCQDVNEEFTSITHVVFASEGATTYDDEDIEMRLIYRRTS